MKAYFENSMTPKTKKTMTNLTLFDDLLQNSESENFQYQHQQDSYPSDCESGISGIDEHVSDIRHTIRLHEGEKVYQVIKNKFVSSLVSHGFCPQVESINKNGYYGIMNQIKYKAFCLYSKGMEIKRNRNANVKYAWFGGSNDELNTILDKGFSFIHSNGVYGSGLYLSPIDQPIESMESTVADVNGVRHMLLCRVILGNTEVISSGSSQYKPSSEEFDSGIDDLVFPKKYIVWNGNINTHILPEFIVSFRVSSFNRGCRKISKPDRVPKSDWMPFATLIQNLSNILPPRDVEFIANYHCEYRKQNITRNDMIQRVRCIAGDKLLMRIIKSYNGKDKSILEKKLKKHTQVEHEGV